MWPPAAAAVAAACICRRGMPPTNHQQWKYRLLFSEISNKNVTGHAKIRLSPPLQTSVEAVAGAVALLVAAAEQRSTWAST
uniref:Uncharacterized protein n=1 Tax=Oryza barthii TaxID=65489 RepID=A0A0D3FW39_9ORYZ